MRYSSVCIGSEKVTQANVTDRNIINVATVLSEDENGKNIEQNNSLTITLRSGGGGSNGVFYPNPINICPTGDFSGNLYDKLCITPEKESKKEPIISEIEKEIGKEDIQGKDTDIEQQDISIPGEKVAPNGQKYTLQEDFISCPIIDNINNDNYIFPQSGLFIDEKTARDMKLLLKFAEIGIFDDYDDGSVQPMRKMTRAEFLKVALISHRYTYRELEGTVKYSDVESGTWQSRVVEKAESLGMIHGYDVGTFQSNKEISKSEAIKILMRISFIHANTLLNSQYKDIDVSWYKFYVQNGETLGLFFPEKDNYIFLPDSSVERQEMVDLINRLVRFYR